MPKNKGKGGKKFKKQASKDHDIKNELVFKEDGQEYAQITKMLGNCRVEAYCADGRKRLCHIRGKMKKKVWITVGDIVLIGLRDFQDEKADVILKYNDDESRSLKSYGELPETIKPNEAIGDPSIEEEKEEDMMAFDFNIDDI